MIEYRHEPDIVKILDSGRRDSSRLELDCGLLFHPYSFPRKAADSP